MTVRIGGEQSDDSGIAFDPHTQTMYWATGARSLFLVATAPPLTDGRSRRPLQRHGEDSRNWSVPGASRADIARQASHDPRRLDVPSLPVVEDA